MEKCRLCFTDPNPEMCQHIFNTKSEPPIWIMIEQLSNLTITKNDPYTKNICGQCFSDLVKYSDFRRQILDTDYRLQHEEEQLLENTNDNCDYFEVHYTPTRSHNDDFIIKEEEIEIEEDPLKIEDESNEGLNNSSIALMNNQDIKVFVDRINNYKKIKASYPIDNSNETYESQSSTDDKIIFNRNSKTSGSYNISTNNGLRLTDNDGIIISDKNERNTAKYVGSSKNFYDNSSCTHSNNDYNGKKEELDIEMNTDNIKKYNTKNSQRLNIDNSIKYKTTKKVSKNKKRHSNNRNDLNMWLKVHTNEMHSTLQSHSREKPYRCNICDRRFSRKFNLHFHTECHTGENPLKCNVCDKSFSTSTYLKDHLNIHTGEKPYCCNICWKTFSSKSGLHIHLKLHKNEKEFECDVCYKQFVQKCGLDAHLRTHTGEKPYKCDVCNKKFRQQSHLRNHNRRMHFDEKS